MAADTQGWYYLDEGQMTGPMPDKKLADLWGKKVTVDTLVWHTTWAEEGRKRDWSKITDVNELAYIHSPPPPSRLPAPSPVAAPAAIAPGGNDAALSAAIDQKNAAEKKSKELEREVEMLQQKVAKLEKEVALFRDHMKRTERTCKSALDLASKTISDSFAALKTEAAKFQ
jgi:exonuclease VII small subunit